ncbi:hypothetical protein B5G34_00825 [Flavonifractor sp. An82]|uniref:DUF4376 domain-containing protein n=1 Tax=Flavonifractor sp. An82 TaxID=1965660 RepID=UPI000B3A4B89|nr:hypothetical protein [Flavonifractor sp. An82]OUN23672.1 hypothetical protein B5G34_00825 [Flavonifractor sp. An82]
MKKKLMDMYKSGVVEASGLFKAAVRGWITIADVAEILGDENATETVRTAKLAEISRMCNVTIESGVDVQIGDRIDHFNLSNNDQNNIDSLFKVVELGGTEYIYQADGGKCSVYSAEEITSIYVTAQRHITKNTAYHNALKQYVNSLSDVDEISAVKYGDELPAPYKEELLTKLAVAEEQMQVILNRIGVYKES